MAGRDISVTHEALGTVRVMRTGGCMGEIVGMAAALCKQHDTLPRGVYQDHLDDLKQLMLEGVGKPPAPLVKLTPPAWLSKAGDNLALRATATASGQHEGDRNPPALANDGQADLSRNEARWLSPAEVPNWIELNWPEPQTISAARVISGFCPNSGHVYAPVEAFVFQVPEGESWCDVAGASATDNGAIDWHQRFEPVTTTRIRLQVNRTSGDISRIWEIELYHPRD
jgi:hypothetical protein